MNSEAIAVRAQQLADLERRTDQWKRDHGAMLSTGGGQSGAPEPKHWAQTAAELGASK